MSPRQSPAAEPSSGGLFQLSRRDPGAFGISTWTVKTPEGSEMRLVWDSAETRLTSQTRGIDGHWRSGPVQPDRFAIPDRRVSTAQAAVERFVRELNDQILQESATRDEGRQADPVSEQRVSDTAPTLF